LALLSLWLPLLRPWRLPFSTCVLLKKAVHLSTHELLALTLTPDLGSLINHTLGSLLRIYSLLPFTIQISNRYSYGHVRKYTTQVPLYFIKEQMNSAASFSCFLVLILTQGREPPPSEFFAKQIEIKQIQPDDEGLANSNSN